MEAGPSPGPSWGLAGVRGADGTRPGPGWGAARAQASPKAPACWSPTQRTQSKGEGAGPQGLRAPGRLEKAGGEGLWTSALHFLAQEPAPCPPASGTHRLLPFPAWKAPSLPPPCPGLWGPQGETWSPQERPCPQVPVAQCWWLFPAPPEPWASPQPGAPAHFNPWAEKEGTAGLQATRDQAQPCARPLRRVLGPCGTLGRTPCLGT